MALKRKAIKPERFRRLRQQGKLTQKEAAAVCGVDERTIQRWELGEVKRGIRFVYLDRLAAHIAGRK